MLVVPGRVATRIVLVPEPVATGVSKLVVDVPFAFVWESQKLVPTSSTSSELFGGQLSMAQSRTPLIKSGSAHTHE